MSQMNTDGQAKGKERSDPETAGIIAAAFEVHNQLGHGFLEGVYAHALSVELALRGIPHQREVYVPVFYKDFELACRYRADVICFERVLVECKAQTGLTEVDEAQVINYLRGTQLEKALLLNFGLPRLQIKRMILTQEYRHVPKLSGEQDSLEYTADG